ncbi:MAG: 30S ribosomal protein S5 [Candidatus Parcubacteria bacterium]|nr:MAG: 30S ribosomal protein S5 [Candidatus Parcubacteria bacterium]
MLDKKQNWEYRVIEIKRVTKVTKGGKAFKIRAVVIVGDKKGRVGIGVEKGDDVSQAVNKAINKAIKNHIIVPIVNGTIPYEVQGKVSAAKVLIKPTRQGRGIIAGGSVKLILELAGLKDVVSKITGVTKNPLTNAMAALKALDKLNRYFIIKQQENKDVNQSD